MLKVHSFTFNPYQENTYLLSDPDGATAIVDPGCYSASEQQALDAYLAEQGLHVELLLNTHGHIDHMLGNAHVKQTYGVPFATHPTVIQELAMAPTWGQAMGLSVAPSPQPDQLLQEGDVIAFGQVELEVLFVPGHSPGHIAFYHRPSFQLFSGDVLFQGSIGRVDLPGGDFDTLMQSIAQKVLPLSDEVKVYCGHGPTTTVGAERRSNPFILQYLS
jgi:hydroxyacylglutathione hydrolase